jgi:hypothetical protein
MTDTAPCIYITSGNGYAQKINPNGIENFQIIEK